MNRYLLAIIVLACISLSAHSGQSDSSTSVTSSFKFSAIAEGQVTKNLWDEFGPKSPSRFPSLSGANGYPEAVEDFWMRVALFGSFKAKNFEGMINLRFYPYWTERRSISAPGTVSNNDLKWYMDLIEVNRAYVKVFTNYSPQNGLTFQPFLKIGRDGILNSSSDLFGNYLDQPAGGYGRNNVNNVTGPFLNKIVFANQLEAGLTFNAFNRFTGKTSIMVGGNLNNDKFYSAPMPVINQYLDSKLSAGFFRMYQDFYFKNIFSGLTDMPILQAIHIGGGLRDYKTTDDSSGIIVKSHYFDAQGAFDVVIIPDVKFYTEIAMQKLGTPSSTGIDRPINMGITIPTFGLVDTLAFEAENVAKTFFSDSSMRDGLGERDIKIPTTAFAWGIVVQKKFMTRVNIAWGLYTGDAYGDMASTLRLSTYF